MELYHLWVVIHVLAWVFWLGTDIGVFIGAKMSENADYSVETRLTVLKLGMILDIAPRVAFPTVFITGVLLMNAVGVTLIPAAAGVIFGLFWLACVLTGIATGGGQGALGQWAMRALTLIHVIITFGMGGLAIASLAGSADLPQWLAIKWLAFAAIAVAAIILEQTFKPAVAIYGRLGAEGASDELNAGLTKALAPVYWAVLAIYAGTLVAGITGLIH